ncbi:hypothetical protein DSC45_06170 [Streptomyces sp. YIM 130001]|uniref:hypothetical protein n=1 Tax=Streptomyces sp. YIM 130001 TaxID=2259644 RepID=UPI000EE0A22F|nr:hypothetical protein [Streptomyces sp. YIM 130001]RII19580.1 hypothetical protein DSC45_06170 [Streptomyces sp. YIM 130001]
MLVTAVRRGLVASVVVLALGGGAVACGGSGDEDAKADAPAASEQGQQEKGTEKEKEAAGDGAPEASPDATEPGEDATKVTGPHPSTADLEKAAATSADVKAAGYTVKKPSASDMEGMGEEKAKKPACAPLADLLGGSPTTPEPAAKVMRQLNSTEAEPKDRAPAVFTFLLSYGEKAGASYVDTLKQSVEACAKGFDTTTPSGAKVYKKAELIEAPAPDAGDEAFSYELAGDLGGMSVPLDFHVVRKGQTVAVFYAMGLEPGAPAKVPGEAVEAQVAKLK